MSFRQLGFIVSLFGFWSLGFGQGYDLPVIVDPSSATPTLSVGAALARMDDLNGDGVDELVVGAPADGQPGLGSVVLYSGIDLLPMLRISGLSNGDGFGSSVAVIDDLDGDGNDDIIAGAPRRNGNAGGVSVHSSATGAVLFSDSGAALGDQLGSTVVVLGDVDGDGLSDFAVAAPSANSNMGQIRVYSGTGQLIRNHNGTQVSEHLGFSIADSDDVDGDGVRDLLATTTGQRAVRVFSGATGALLTSHVSLGATQCDDVGDVDGDGVPDLIAGGGQAIRVFSGSNGAMIYEVLGGIFSNLGFVVYGLGDVNADNVPDFAALQTISIQPVITVYSGSTGAILGNLTGSSLEFGRSLLSLGDPNGDGAPDFIVGESSAQLGLGVVHYFSGVGGPSVVVLIGQDREAGFGESVVRLFDVNGDGRDDLAVGSPLRDFLGRVDAGRIGIYDGATLTLIHEITGTTPNGRRGTELVAAPDLNGDGAGDLFDVARSGGLVTVFSGSDGSVLYQIAPASFLSNRFTDVAFIDDMNADGTPDFAMVVQSITFNIVFSEQIQIRSGVDGTLISNLTPFSADFAASRLLGVPDADGDGMADVLIGSPKSDFAAFDAGRVELRSSATGNILMSRDGGTPGEELGASLALTRDVDNDGVDDLLIAAPGYLAGASSNAGRVQVISTMTGMPMGEVTGLTFNERLGTTLTPLDDLDGDGREEIAVRVFLSTTMNYEVRVVSIPSGQILAARTASTTTELGISLVSFDLNDDGLEDLLIGASGDTGDEGSVRVLSHVGVPVGSNRFGTGCATAPAAPPVISAFGGDATSVGNSQFGVAVTRVAHPSLVTVLAGQSNTFASFGQLPFDLSPFGFTGCSILVSAEQATSGITVASETGFGSYFLPSGIPAIPALAGFTAHLQAVVSANAPLGSGPAFSAGLTLVIQEAHLLL